ncbi:unnamed protein product [Bursaphelenchus okinawaensis]|uniref:Aldehyde dehydrogenase n=1 Tax=Bursaphelenchus okinawaensis TaxID=465554 RepID=A0A811L9X8_9BILA|nr:unnamed protein product [Bursaphelenchus okinawaensis]CAG9121796.1 unnamed protein product [Bursaphelenchus okinawaensis]
MGELHNYQKHVDKLRQGFNAGVNKSYEARISHLKTLARLLTENEERFVKALYQDLRKPELEAKSNETTFTLGKINHAIANLSKWMVPQKVDRTITQALDSAYRHPEPLGVVLIIGPWNFPFLLTVSPIIGALAAGNTVLLKPSELAPETERLFLEIFPKYFRDDVVKVVQADAKQTGEILKIPFDHILFTGSSPVGKIIMRAAAEHLTPVTLELGGKDPAVVAPDVDIRIAARRIMWGKLLNNGQACISPDYAMVIGNTERKNKFVVECINCIKEYYGENVHDSKDYGRIINEKNFDRLCHLIDKTDGKILYGGRRERAEKFIEPTLISVEEDDITMDDEIFGPILPIFSVPTVDEAIKSINRREKPLVLYLFTDSKDTVKQVKENTSSGTLTINDTIMHFTVETLPFGGVGNSGMGKYHGKAGFDTFSHFKSVLHRSSWFESMLSARYPPFDAKKLRFMLRLITLSKYRSPI